jgi:hypothetical protein
MLPPNGRCGRVVFGLLIGLWACTPGDDTRASRPAAPVRSLRLPGTPDDSTRIDQLIKQLGSEQFAEREAASRELAAYGESALSALRRASRSEDPEVRRRARELLRAIVTRLLNPPKMPGAKEPPLLWDGVGR